MKRLSWLCYCSPDVIKQTQTLFSVLSSHLSFLPLLLFIPPPFLPRSPQFHLVFFLHFLLNPSFPSLLNFIAWNLSLYLWSLHISNFISLTKHHPLLLVSQLHISGFSGVCVYHGVHSSSFQWAVCSQRRSRLSLGGVQGPHPLSKTWHSKYTRILQH